jgi:hypothetical protein
MTCSTTKSDGMCKSCVYPDPRTYHRTLCLSGGQYMRVPLVFHANHLVFKANQRLALLSGRVL